MSVFENEGNVSQDANFRRHLDDNWDSGNREFDKVEGLLDTLEKNLSSYHGEIDKLKTFFDNLKDQHTQDVDTLNQTIKKQNDRISKLEDAVFGYGEYETNYETPPKTIDHVLEINTDSNPKLKGE